MWSKNMTMLEHRYETKTEYIDRIWRTITPEMREYLDTLAIPCACDWEECTGWRLKTMLRSELPKDALARRTVR